MVTIIASGIMVLFIGGILVAILLLGGGLAVTKNFNMRSLYLYLVCLITLVIFIFGTIFTIQRSVDLLLEGEYYYQSFEDFQQRYYYYGPDGKRQEPELTQEEIQQRYDEYLAQEAIRIRNNNIRDLSYSISAMLVGGGFWFYHWKKIKED